MRQLLLVTVLVILYGSLYPWHFAYIPGRPFLLPISFDDKPDFALNIWLYAPVGAIAFWAFARTGIMRWIIPVCLGLALSTFVELVQFFIPFRVSSLGDILANGLGTLAGMLLAGWVGSAPSFSRWQLRRSPEALLLSCWAAFLCFPLLPVHESGGLMANVRAFQESSFLSSALAVWTIAWFVVWELIPGAFARDTFWIVVGSLLLLLPARLFLMLRVLTKAELAAGLLALCGPLFFRRRRILPWVLATAILAALAIRSLTPLEFSASATPFSWIPLGASLTSPSEPAMLVLISKVFWYGTAVWALDRCGLGLGWSGVILAVLLASIEIVQSHMPTHAPEITDPLMAFACAAAFWMVSRSTTRNPRTPLP
jgi:VanZ family protein